MPVIEPIAIGAGNPRLKRLRRLVARPRARREDGAFVVEGPILVAEALRSGLVVEEVFAAPGTDLGSLGAATATAACAVYEVEAPLLASILDPVTPRPVAAVVSAPRWTVDDLAAGRILPVAVELRDPGNLGSLIRTAEGSGAAGLLVVGDAVDHLSPKVVRASAGSVLRVPIVRHPDLPEALHAIRARGWTVLAAVVDQSAPTYDGLDLTGAAVLLGNEPHGLPETASRLADARFTIPLAESVESLNVAAAGAVLCFEAARQRRAAPQHPKLDGRPDPETSGCT